MDMGRRHGHALVDLMREMGTGRLHEEIEFLV